MKPDLLGRTHLLYEAAQQLGWPDAKAVAERARILDRGLPAEDELSVILHWLGNCVLVHKLDQEQFPSESKSEFRVPDLLAVFAYENRNIPVLIEVKATDENALNWREDYLGGLDRYAALLHLPLLVAWKHRTFWCLFESTHFKRALTNFKAKFIEVMTENLMSLLAGDFSFAFRQGVTLTMRIRKVRQTDTGWETIFEETYFTNGNGEKVASAKGVLPMFLCIHQDVDLLDEGTHFIQKYIISQDQAEFASRALSEILQLFTARGSEIDWRNVLQTAAVPEMIKDLRGSAEAAMQSGFLKMLVNQKPRTKPGFLTKFTE
jgi:Holliday junction resolvase